MVFSGVGKERWRYGVPNGEGRPMGTHDREGRCLVGGEDEVHEKEGLANWERGGRRGFWIGA